MTQTDDPVSKVRAETVLTKQNPPNIKKTNCFFTGGSRVVATGRTFESNSDDTHIIFCACANADIIPADRKQRLR
ncbi:MAG: hypothetical protein LC725_08980, partial [Lentisphaerae bacterium]|nr:hypothetical protein [Lentisphaerota bacterium]